MTELQNKYLFEREYGYDEETRTSTYNDSCLKVFRNNRYYQTKKRLEDLPEYYCPVHRYCGNYDVIRTDIVKDLKYHWVKENHFMKDSMLRISFTDDIKEKNMTYNINGKEVISIFKDYENVDAIVFGNNIFKYLGYVKKYSGYDLSKIRKQFVEQCEWLKDNEPCFAPDTDNFGKWFDYTIEKAILWRT